MLWVCIPARLWSVARVSSSAAVGKCGSSGYCFLCTDYNISFTLSQERGSNRRRSRAQQSARRCRMKRDKTALDLHIVFFYRCLNIQMLHLHAWFLHNSVYFYHCKKNKHFVSKTVWHEEPTYMSETSNKIYSVPHLDF